MQFHQSTRRELITLFGGAAVVWPLASHAQWQGRIPKVGVLWHAASAEEEGPLFTGLVEGFKKLGYVDGRNITLEHRFPNEMPERFKSLATELVSLNVDALVSAGIQAALALREATKTIPIVFMFMPDPVGSKLGSVLNKDSNESRVVIQGFRIAGGLDGEATILAERSAMGTARTLAAARTAWGASRR